MANLSSVLAWRIPGEGEPGGLLSMGSHRVRHDWSDLAADLAATVEKFYFHKWEIWIAHKMNSHYFSFHHSWLFHPIDSSRFWLLFTMFFLYFFCIGFAIHQHESAIGIHMFPILNPPPPPSPYRPSGWSQRTSPKHPVSCIEPGLAIRFIYYIIHVSMPFFQIIPIGFRLLSPFPIYHLTFDEILNQSEFKIIFY